MPFDESKDVCIKEWIMYDEESAENLAVSVRQYNEGERKFQIGPRTTIGKNGKVRTFKAGRLTQDEVAWLSEILPEISEIL